MNALLFLTLVAAAPSPGTAPLLMSPVVPTVSPSENNADGLKLAQSVGKDEVAPLPAVDVTATEPGGIPLDDSVVGEAPPVFSAPAAEPEAEGGPTVGRSLP